MEHTKTPANDPTWYDRVPKVELHLHIEGAIPLPALWELICRYGGDPQVPTRESLATRFAYQGFAHFLEIWRWTNGFLRTYEDLTWIAEAVAHDLMRQNVGYAEAFYSPADHAKHGMETGRVTEALRRGLERVPGVQVALIADVVRDSGPQSALRVVEEVGETLDLGVIGIGMGGSEADWPPEPFAPAYARARALGLRTTVHAGEAAGPPSVWGALRALHPERIGHGTRACEDPGLLVRLAAEGIAVEACPLSNVRTRVVPSLREHPLRRFLDHGIAVSVNTDDPAMFGNSLAEEYRLLEEELGCTRDQVRGLILAGIETSRLPDTGKRRRIAEFIRHPAWLEDATTSS